MAYTLIYSLFHVKSTFYFKNYLDMATFLMVFLSWIHRQWPITAKDWRQPVTVSQNRTSSIAIGPAQPALPLCLSFGALPFPCENLASTAFWIVFKRKLLPTSPTSITFLKTTKELLKKLKAIIIDHLVKFNIFSQDHSFSWDYVLVPTKFYSCLYFILVSVSMPEKKTFFFVSFYFCAAILNI